MALVSPPFPTGRLRLRLSPGRDGRAALSIYRPLVLTGRVLKAGTALVSVLPYPVRVAGRAEPLVELLAELLDIRVDGACVLASSAPGRQVVGVAAGGRLVAVAKVGRPDDEALRHEAAVLGQLRSAGPLRVPKLIVAAPVGDVFVSATEPVFGPPRPDDRALLHAGLALADQDVTHGDLAPWNLVGEPPTLLDWESSSPGHLPLFDLTHFVLRRELLQRRGRTGAVLRALCQPGGVGASYLARLGLAPARAPALVLDYLDRTADASRSAAESRLHTELRSRLS